MQEFVEYPVHELGRMRAAEALGELDGFVDGGAVGRIGIEDFVRAEAEHVAVGGGHAGDAPVIRDGRELRIDFALIAANAENQRHAEFFEVRRVQSAVDERFHLGDGRARVYVILKQDLQGNFAGT